MVHSHLGNSHVVIDGQFVSQRVSRIVEAIKDYEPNIDVQWVPPTARAEGQPAFKIVYTSPLAIETLFHVQTEDEFDERVLLRIIANDQRRGPVKLTELELFDQAQRLLAQQDWLDKMEEANDVAYHVLKTHLNTYKVSDELTIKDGIPFNANLLKD